MTNETIQKCSCDISNFNGIHFGIHINVVLVNQPSIDNDTDTEFIKNNQIF